MTVKLDRRLHDILIRDDIDHFTAVELRNTYIEQYGASEKLDPTGIWKLVYRQVNRLVKHGFLLKQGDPNGRHSTYVKTPEFHETEFRLPAMTSQVPRKEERSPSGALDDQLVQALRDRAKQYQVDLSASIGESEEYVHLYDVYPDLKPQLEPQYLKARERSSRLLGQLRAIENILADYETHA